jgi:hypothetical protein
MGSWPSPWQNQPARGLPYCRMIKLRLPELYSTCLIQTKCQKCSQPLTLSPALIRLRTNLCTRSAADIDGQLLMVAFEHSTTKR